jgi:putative SOS response-associated peptidase YedK
MCGRYAANRDTGTLTEVFKLKNLPSQLLTENYNISPTSKTYAIRLDKNQNRTLEIMTWGLIPSWAKDNSMSAKMINARFETVDEKHSFRSAFSKRRCIVPMDGYYEWFRPLNPKEKKQPYFIKAKNSPLLAVAGIYEIWKNPDTKNYEPEVHSFSVITTEAKLGLETIHDRMPVLVPDNNWQAWLDPSIQNKEEVRSLVATPSNDYFEYFKVSSDVNNARNNGNQLIQPTAE